MRGCKPCDAELIVSPSAGTSHCLNENLRHLLLLPAGLICET